MEEIERGSKDLKWVSMVRSLLIGRKLSFEERSKEEDRQVGDNFCETEGPFNRFQLFL